MNPALEIHAVVRTGESTGFALRTVFSVLAIAVCYYVATRIAWALCFPDSEVALFFPPHGVLVSVLLLTPTRHWWAYVLAAAGSHFIATQQFHWPPLAALHSEVFDAVKGVAVAAGMRLFIKSPFHLITLREALIFVLIAVIVVPFGAALFGAPFATLHQAGSSYWIEWRNLGISNAVTSIVLIPAILLGAYRYSAKWTRLAPGRILEAGCLGAGLVAIGIFAFDRLPSGPETSPALLYAPIPFLIWAALRFGLGGVSVSMLVLTIQAIWGIMNGRGPFLDQSPSENALAFQMFLLMTATPLMLLTVAIDDERRSKEALRASEERISLAAESAQLALWEWDLTRDHLWVTDEGREFFGIEPGERIDYVSLNGRVHPDDRAARAAAMERARDTDGCYEAEYRIVLPDGSVRWVAARGRRPHNGDGSPPRILGVSMDITRQKQAHAEAQLQREELAHLSRVASLGVLSGSLAHELNQPLGSILSNAQAAQHLVAVEKPDLVELRAILSDIVSEDRRARNVITQLRVMLRRGEIVLQPVAVNESIEELLQLTRHNLGARGVEVSCELAANLPAAVADCVQLQQVLLNLIINACDAMEGNPPGERPLTITTCVEGSEVHITVLDRGVGLPENVEAIFQPFHTTKAHGLGMGLAICRTLITAHGGRIWATPRADGGAAFHVMLNVAYSAA